MKTILKFRHIIILLTLFSAFAFSLNAGEITCPVDNSNTYFTGQTMVDVSGKQLWLYKCTLYGHELWIVKNH